MFRKWDAHEVESMNDKTIMTGGCFNKIHEGHRKILNKLKEKGKVIIVLTHDLHNRKKNALPARQRKKNLEKEGLADEVVIGDPHDYMKVIRKYDPDIIALGYDQKMPDKIKTKARIIKMKKYEAKDK